MHAFPFWGQGRGSPVGRECPTCDWESIGQTNGILFFRPFTDQKTNMWFEPTKYGCQQFLKHLMPQNGERT